jgi:hypothetical protein
MRRQTAIAIATLATSVSALHAQPRNELPTPIRDAPPQRRPFCYGGAPLSSCRAFAVTEVVYHLRDDSSRSGLEPYLSWSYGVMVNVTEASAVGIARTYSGLSSSPSGLRPAWAIRYRHWTGTPLALDASISLAGSEQGDSARRLSANVGVTFPGDYFGLFAHLEDSPDGAQWSGALRFGSWPGLLLGAAGWLLYLWVPST